MVGAKFPLPLCVSSATGQAREPFTEDDLDKIGNDIEGADTRSKALSVLGTDSSVDNPNDLQQAGWGAIFASDADPKIKTLLQPLLDWRAKQVHEKDLFQVFDGDRGVTPGQNARDWARIRGVSLTAPVSPSDGVPYYLLLVGSPQAISFEFQASMKMQWAVGRLHFDDIQDYGSYAANVVKYEAKDFKPAQGKHAAVWMPQNPDDQATLMLSTTMNQYFNQPGKELGRKKYSVDYFIAEKATKPQLLEIVQGKLDAGAPAVIFTGSHGTECPPDDVTTQRKQQGALVTQEWTQGKVLGTENLFTGDDVPGDAQLLGTMVFLFACFSGGCPKNDSYFFNPDGTAKQIAADDLIARLPQKLLSHGTLAVFGHIDQAFCYSFINPDDTPQPQVIRTPLEALMFGWRAGLAADKLTSVWSALSNSIGQMPVKPNPAYDPAALATLVIARDEAKNYFLLGDPAVQLRVNDLG